MTESEPARLGFHSDPRHTVHDVPSHPERPERVEAIVEELRATGMRPRLATLPDRVANEHELRLVHDPRLIDQLYRFDGAGGARLDPDTIMLSGSFDAAARAAGGVLNAVDRVIGGELDAAFCANRPPGHHATPTRAMGFCLFNQIAVAARYAQRTHGLARVAVIDFDVHHGNGTQEIFERDASVLYVSTHESPFYPGTGDWRETGVGNLVNLPLPAGCGDAEYAAAFDRIIVPAVRRFRPELLLVSAGFDAHLADPLANMTVTEAGYAYMARRIQELAGESAGGRSVWVLEGGYRLDALAASTAAHVAALMEAAG